MVDLKDKVVVITGASSGIGKATAIAFARKGSRVVLAARTIERLHELKKYITSCNGKSVCVQTDVTCEQDVVNLFNETEKAFGRIDILINNAGKGLEAEVCDISCDEWHSVINTNLTSVFLCTREAVRRMKEKKIRGHVITVSSTSGLFGVPTYAAYCAAKHGIRGFANSIRWEVRKHNIRISTIYPANVDTSFFTTLTTTPRRRDMLTAEDIADHLVAIASQSLFRILAVRMLLVGKRIYYFTKYFLS